MKCPVCKTTDLLMTERRSIEIDYCPVCRGIWLDRGELDKLIAQDAASDDTSVNAARPIRDGHHADRDRGHDRAYDNNRTYDNRTYDNHRTDYRAQKKKRSLFDMFDFD
ncbi:zf-TFIIB domain-containing protein [Paraburkholderia sediminicola]|uniref:TFIIB-type zinc ribbon-containing protein n=1 Tax=Paraburkholderia sediminicola TaxID=458836 RepID=UPI0038B7E2C9